MSEPLSEVNVLHALCTSYIVNVIFKVKLYVQLWQQSLFMPAYIKVINSSYLATVHNFITATTTVIAQLALPFACHYLLRLTPLRLLFSKWNGDPLGILHTSEQFTILNAKPERVQARSAAQLSEVWAIIQPAETTSGGDRQKLADNATCPYSSFN